MSVQVVNPTQLDTKNIKTLSDRKRGDVYRVENGLLKKMSFIQKIFLFLSKIFHTSYYVQSQADVKHTINSLVSRIESGNKGMLTNLFFKRLTPVSENIYERTQINPKVLAILRRLLENTDDFQKLENKKLNRQNSLSFFSRFYFREDKVLGNIQKYKRVLVEAKLATNLGIRCSKPGDGYSKRYMIKDLNHNIIGVFKPAIGDSLSMQAPFWPMRLRNKLLSKFGYGGSTFKHLAGKCHIAEWASYEMDEEIGTHIVPPTAVIHLDPIRWKRKKTSEIKGSLQIFVKGAVDAREFFGLHKNYKKADPLTSSTIELADELFDKLVINDVLSGNLDRHSENWLILRDKHNPNIVENIALIDGGMAFSPTHANSSFERNKQYIWATTAFEWAQRKFSTQAKEIIKDVYNRRFHLRQKLIKLYLAEKERPQVAIKRADRMVERIEMLRYVAITKDMRNYKLIHFRTQPEMDRVARLIQCGA